MRTVTLALALALSLAGCLRNKIDVCADDPGSFPDDCLDGGSSRDAGTEADTGTPDAGTPDAGPVDAGPEDASTEDAPDA